MNGKTAKKLRKLSSQLTIGKDSDETKSLYNQLKKVHNKVKKKL